ncbi:MAG TPA: hypothetical protein VFN56_00720 [Candidatus Saccharimonadales bacterium]|nr:hypothetical protein [Candidatus Saccharimonadales bacterium]
MKRSTEAYNDVIKECYVRADKKWWQAIGSFVVSSTFVGITAYDAAKGANAAYIGICSAFASLSVGNGIASLVSSMRNSNEAAALQSALATYLLENPYSQNSVE